MEILLLLVIVVILAYAYPKAAEGAAVEFGGILGWAFGIAWDVCRWLLGIVAILASGGALILICHLAGW